MDSTSLALSLLFGAIGMGFCMYGKKAGRPVPLVAGLGLMTFPYFIPNDVACGTVCGVLTVLPYFLRNA